MDKNSVTKNATNCNVTMCESVNRKSYANFMGIDHGKLTVIMGEPGSGVTTTALRIAYQCLAEKNEDVCILSSELVNKEIMLMLQQIREEQSKQVDIESPSNVFMPNCEVVPARFKDTMLGILENHPTIKCIIVDRADLFTDFNVEDRDKELLTLEEQGKALALQAGVSVVFTQGLRGESLAAFHRGESITLNYVTEDFKGHKCVDNCICLYKDRTGFLH